MLKLLTAAAAGHVRYRIGSTGLAKKAWRWSWGNEVKPWDFQKQ
jgi:hypothetical protein